MFQDLSSPPRQVRLRGIYRFSRILLLVLLVGCPPGFLIAGINKAGELRKLAEEGVTTQATVKGKRTKRKRHGKRYIINYRFEVDGQVYAGTARTRKSAWKRLKVGDTLVVSYWSSGPELNRYGTVSSNDVKSKLRSTWIIAGVILLVFGVVVFFCERTWRRFVVLLREGRAIQGEVISFEAYKRKRKKDRLQYTFRAPSGSNIEGLDRLQQPQDPPPEPGTPVTVLQDRENPKNFATLPRLHEYAVLVTNRV